MLYDLLEIMLVVSTDQYVWNEASHVQATASKMLSLTVTFMCCSVWL